MSQKKFVKYAYLDNNNNKTPTNRERKAHRKSYQEKFNSKGDLIKSMVSYFTTIAKPPPKIQELIKLHPKFFTSQPKNPEREKVQNMNQFVILLRKPIQERQKKPMIEEEEQDDPNWDSNQEQELSLTSKTIDQQVLEKMKDKLANVAPKTKDELKRHEKQFLQDYFRKKNKPQQEQQKIQQLVKEIKIQEKVSQQPNKLFGFIDFSGQGILGKNPLAQLALLKNNSSNLQECWIQKLPIDDDNFEYVEDDGLFDNESKASEEKSMEASSSDQDDAFVDDKPTTIVSNKGLAESKKQIIKDKQEEHSGLVVLSNFTFKFIAEKVGLHPGTCIWVISNNRKERYKVSTQYMDEVYRQNHLYEHFPFISLNHSQFVHNNDISTPQALEKFKRFNERKKQFLDMKENGITKKVGNSNYRNHQSYKKK